MPAQMQTVLGAYKILHTFSSRETQSRPVYRCQRGIPVVTNAVLSTTRTPRCERKGSCLKDFEVTMMPFGIQERLQLESEV